MLLRCKIVIFIKIQAIFFSLLKNTTFEMYDKQQKK